MINTDGKIRCRVSANPPAVISWKKDNQILSERYITESDGIKVTGVNEEDKGNFTVRAMVQQTGRFQALNINVEVHGKINYDLFKNKLMLIFEISLINIVKF